MINFDNKSDKFVGAEISFDEAMMSVNVLAANNIKLKYLVNNKDAIGTTILYSMRGRGDISVLPDVSDNVLEKVFNALKTLSSTGILTWVAVASQRVLVIDGKEIPSLCCESRTSDFHKVSMLPFNIEGNVVTCQPVRFIKDLTKISLCLDSLFD